MDGCTQSPISLNKIGLSGKETLLAPSRSINLLFIKKKETNEIDKGALREVFHKYSTYFIVALSGKKCSFNLRSVGKREPWMYCGMFHHLKMEY